MKRHALARDERELIPAALHNSILLRLNFLMETIKAAKHVGKARGWHIPAPPLVETVKTPAMVVQSERYDSTMYGAGLRRMSIQLAAVWYIAAPSPTFITLFGTDSTMTSE